MKRYGGVRALRGASLTVGGAGAVHGLIGENGSGKSTMLGILSGQIQADTGRIELDGVPITLSSPSDALAKGIAMVSQETSVALDLSVAENIFMGHRMERKWYGVDWSSTYEKARELMKLVGLDCAPTEIMRTLRPDQCQMVEIVRALSLQSRILILDEPTSSLTDTEVAALFAALRRLSAAGVSTVFVSHKLDELTEISDEITVLRDGETVAAGAASDFTADSLIRAMVGGRPRSSSRAARQRARGGEAALALEDLSLATAFDNVTLNVAPGEIVGLSGLVGAGRSELLASIFGVRPATSGTVRVGGRPLVARSPTEAIKHGLGYVPANRKTDGVVLPMSVSNNLTMVSRRDHARLRAPTLSAEDQEVETIADSVQLNAPSTRAAVQTLSGGNQQKVVLGKWLAAHPRVLLLDEPTRGVDVNAKHEIHALLRAAADSGMSLLVSSSESSELRNLCDRIVVMFRGRVAAALPVDEASDDTLARYAGGHT